MSLKRRSKVDATFSMSSMTDIVFLLLVFFMIASTMIGPPSLKIALPESSQGKSNKSIFTIYINSNVKYSYSNGTDDAISCNFSDLSPALQTTFPQGEIKKGQPRPVVMLQAEKSVPVEEVVKVMSLARELNYTLLLGTTNKK
ncbi:biopolymer transporter ExbD [Halosquirtibacter laminarini]|uniref:Biopolymer transporter ExbD n=1 Tax=Halosquirtibacter laminarini TaxID=3374600 RepID=A0AC61NR43_9BACT|nr:biopolymer transporter ExbD [Prolixibacteraceae bacterium]